MVWAKGHRLQSGKYIIEKKLGKGGFGTTYKAIHTILNQYFVVKILNEDLQYELNYQDHVNRFIKEGKILLQLSLQTNTNIVGVRDLFPEGDIYCLVMDFVDGENLLKIVGKRGKIPEGEGLKYIKQIGEALCVIHKAGLTHRDVHPGNMMINRNGDAVLIDFGLTKNINPSTRTNLTLAGNPAFAPYEQFIEGSRQPNLDVYSLAASSYFILTGKLPKDSMTRRLKGENLIPPKQVNSSISNRVNEAIIAGMALEPEHRPQSMAAWLQLLENPVTTKPNSQQSKQAFSHTQRVVPQSVNQTKPVRKVSRSSPSTLAKVFSDIGFLTELIQLFSLYLITSFFILIILLPAIHNLFWQVIIVFAVAVFMGLFMSLLGLNYLYNDAFFKETKKEWLDAKQPSYEQIANATESREKYKKIFDKREFFLIYFCVSFLGTMIASLMTFIVSLFFI